jgi:cytochrome c peroxidase
VKGKGLLAVAITVSIWASLTSGETPAERAFATKPNTKEHLGEQLFFDKILSATQTISCASCHIPSHGFADTTAVSTGIHGRKGTRNTPSCTNMAERPYFFHDGRAATLEDQVVIPVENPVEMGLSAHDAVARLRQNKAYVASFRKLFGTSPTEKHLRSALAAYVRTLETSRTPFDRYMDGDDSAISAAAIRGRELFMSPKAKCFDCHFSPDFTGDEFRNIGLFDGKSLTDSGRFAISHNISDLGKFKVPGLRNVAITAPYMHNGMFRTLREVIDYYDNPYNTVPAPVNMDTLLLKPLLLSDAEKDDLEQFLLTLTDDRFVQQSLK